MTSRKSSIDLSFLSAVVKINLKLNFHADRVIMRGKLFETKKKKQNGKVSPNHK